MDKRTKILGSVFAIILGYVFCSQIAYPKWIAPQLAIGDEIVELQEELDKYEDTLGEFTEKKYAYRDYLARVGTMDPELAANQVSARINDLIKNHSMEEDAQVTPGTRPQVDKKTGLIRKSFTIRATGKLESVVGFLQALSELPYVMRIDNPRLVPKANRRLKHPPDLVTIQNMKMEVMILPQHKALGKKFEDAELKQPEKVVRHLGLDYPMIAARDPFRPPEPPPVVVVAQPPPPPPPPTTQKDKGPPPPPPPPPVRRRAFWPDRASLKLTGLHSVWVGDELIGQEALVSNNGANQRYVALGEEIDGGELLYVHRTGILVRILKGDRAGEHIVYPKGRPLTADVSILRANDYPELQDISKRIQALEAERKKAADEKAKLEQAKKAVEAEVGKNAEPANQKLQKPEATPAGKKDAGKGVEAKGAKPTTGEKPKPGDPAKKTDDKGDPSDASKGKDGSKDGEAKKDDPDPTKPKGDPESGPDPKKPDGKDKSTDGEDDKSTGGKDDKPKGGKDNKTTGGKDAKTGAKKTDG